MSVLPRVCVVCGGRSVDGPRCADCQAAGVETSRPTACGRCGRTAPPGRRWHDRCDPTSSAGRRERQPWRSGYTHPDYIAGRPVVIERSGGRCERRRCRLPLHQVDHVVPLADGGLPGLPNLEGLCAEHHRTKTNMDRARRRGRR